MPTSGAFAEDMAFLGQLAMQPMHPPLPMSLPLCGVWPATSSSPDLLLSQAVVTLISCGLAAEDAWQSAGRNCCSAPPFLLADVLVAGSPVPQDRRTRKDSADAASHPQPGRF